MQRSELLLRETVNIFLCMNFIRGCIEESGLSHTHLRLNTLFSEEIITDAFGPINVSGNPERIIYLAGRMTLVCRETVKWMQSVNGVVTDEVFDKLKRIAARTPSNHILNVDRYLTTFKSELRDLRDNPPKDGETRNISICLQLTFPETLNDELNAEVERIFPLLSPLLLEEETL